MKKLEKLILYFTLFIVAILICLGTIENGVLFTILTFIIIYLFVKKIKINKFYIFLIIFCLITKVLSVIILKIPVISDYYIMLEASKQTLLGDLSYVHSNYFSHWGYQLFHVFYQALMLKFINNILFLKILNCIYSTVITVLIYLIVKKTTNETTARITSLLYSISIYPLYLNTVLGNQQLSLMLILIAIYILFFKKNSIKNLIIIGILIGLGNLERPEGIIYILTILIYLIINNKKIRDTLKNITIIIITYFLITKVPSYIMIQTGLNDIGLTNTNPEWKFLLGFNYEYSGKNNSQDDFYLDNETEEILNRLQEYEKIPKLFYEKIKIQWLYDDVDIDVNSQSNEQFSQKLMNIVINYMKVINMCIILLAFYGIYKNKKIDKIAFFFITNICIYFGVYLFIEVNARYYYNAQISIIILSALGISKLLYILDKKIKKNNTLMRVKS